MKTVMLFIDGFGIGKDDGKINPFVSARLHCFDALLGGERVGVCRAAHARQASLVPTDPRLGVEGLPQSATGQTALLTGINAAKVVGRHINAYPTKTLKEIICSYSLLKEAVLRGFKTTFANMFTERYFRLVEEKRVRHSATTLATLAAGLPLRMEGDFLLGKAVYQDITNETLISRGINLPLIAPEEAGKRLGRIVNEHDLTLFEYFQTDIAGHSRDMERCVEIIERYDQFLDALLQNLDLGNTLVLICSDHGNIEDLSVKTHTLNDVPTIIIGNGVERFKEKVKSIIDIPRVVLESLSN
jgi:hypothetical protein